MKRYLSFLFLFLTITLSMKSQELTDSLDVADSKDALVEIKTSLGDVVIELYNDTPLHRDNFLKLVSEGFYDGVLFHRVIDGFMIQTGDPDSKNAAPGAMLGAGNPGYTVEAEIDYPHHFHKYGALAAARSGDNVNPERRSSGSQFYIVTGKTVTERQIEAMNMKKYEADMQAYFNKLVRENSETIQAMRAAGDKEGLEQLQQKLIKETETNVDIQPLPANLKESYLEKGGAPHLDGAYTVFGEVVKGMDVVEQIQKVETDSHDRPVEDVKILSVRLLKSFE